MAVRSKLIEQVKQLLFLAPVSLTGSSEVYSVVIDRQKYASAAIAVMVGTLTGSGTHSVALKLYHNTANSTSGGADSGLTFTGGPLVNATPLATLQAQLEGLNRYIYIGLTPTFGGSETAALVAASITLGDAQDVEPVA